MIIEIKLLLNQYQGNAWHHAHCEGLIDWPPAPWRTLRALLAGAYNVNLITRHSSTLKSVLHKMSQVKPSYYLPPTTYIQHRSPRPQVVSEAKVKPGKTLYAAGLLMDSQNSTIYISYPIELTQTEDLVLRLTLNGLTYLGRKEAAAEWTVVEEMRLHEPNALPDSKGTRIVAIPDPDLDADQLWEVLNLSAADVFNKNKQAILPGVGQTAYRIEMPVIPSETRSVSYTKVVKLQVASDYGVPMHLAPKLCERLHLSLVKRCPSPIFTGQVYGQPLNSHDHTFIQPIPDRTARYVDSLQLISTSGYSQDAIACITACQWVRIEEQFVQLQLVDFSQNTGEANTRWDSITPMFLTRFPKTRRGKPRYLPQTEYQFDSPEHQALKYLLFLKHLELSGKPSFKAVENGLAMLLDGELAVVANCTPWSKPWQWQTERIHGRQVGRIGYQVKLEFIKPVAVPIGLGHACHYGLGAMLPVRGWVDVESLIPSKADLQASVG